MVFLRRFLAALIVVSSLAFFLPLQVSASSLKIQQETWLKEIYRQGEEIIVAASLQAGGRRYASGPLLSEVVFKVVFEFESGKRESVTLHDSGDRPEHGDISTDDGIWSNRFSLNQAGLANVIITASGVFRNRPFDLQAGLGQLLVNKPGRIVFTEPDQSELVFSSGRKIVLPLRVNNLSELEETVYIELFEPEGSVKPTTLVLAPEEGLELLLEVSPKSPDRSEPLELVLNFKSDSPLTTVQPRQMVLTVTVISTGEAILRWLETFRQGLTAIIAAAGLIVFLFFFSGILLYILKARPLEKIGGTFSYRKVGGAEGKPLQPLTGPEAVDSLVICFGSSEAEADLTLSYQQSAYLLRIIAAWQSRLPRIIRGWQVLFNRPSPAAVLVTSSPPGVIEYREEIYSKVIVYPGEEFLSGGYLFKYEALPGKALQEKGQPEAEGVASDKNS